MRARVKKWLAADGDEKRALMRRRIVKWSSTVTVALFIFFVVIPTSIKWSIEYWLHDKGHIEADIGGLWFNLFTGRLSLSGVEAGKSGVERLDFTIADANMGWMPLIGKKIFIDKVELKDAVFDIRHHEDGTIIAGGIEIKPTEDEPEETVEEEDSGEPWGLGTGPIDLTNVRFLYYAPNVSADLLIHSLHVDPMASWEPDTPSTVTLDIELNGERATFSGQALPFASDPQVEGQLKVNRFSLEWIAKMLVEEGITLLEGDIHIDGFVKLKQTEEGAGREASFVGKVGLEGFAIEQEGMKASLGSLLVDGKIDDSLRGGDGADGFSGAITLKELSLEADAGRAGLKALSLVGDSGFFLDRAGKVTVTHKGDLVLEEVSGASDGSQASVGLTELKTDTEFSLGREGKGAATYDGTVRIENALAEDGKTLVEGMPTKASVDLQTLSGSVDATFLVGEGDFSLLLDTILATETQGAKVPQATLEKTSVDWKGTVEVLAASQGQTVKTDGELRVTDFAAALNEPAVKVAHKSLIWKGDGGYTSADGEFIPKANGAVDLGGFKVRRSNDNGVLVDLKKLALAGFAMDGVDDIGFEKMSLDSLKGLARAPKDKAKKKTKKTTRKDRVKEPDHVALLKAMKVEGVKLSGLSRFETESVSVDSLALWIERDKEGAFELVKLLPDFGGQEAGAAPKDADTPPAKADKGAEFTVAVGKFEVVGDNTTVFSDPSLSPAYHTQLTDILFSLRDFDSADKALATSVELTSTVDKYGKVSLKGKGLPLAELPTLSATVSIEGINLAPLTSYTNRYIGYRLVSGLMDFEASAEITAGEVDAQTHAHINKLEMESLHPDEQDEFTQELGIPVNLALALLTDKNDDIDLDIPVSGSLNDPSFGIGDIIGQLAMKATVQAVKLAAVNYFAPLRILFLAGDVIDLATALSIDPVLFEAGLYEVDPKGAEHMGTMVELFDNRPGIRLQICGVAAYADRDLFARELMQDKLEELNRIGLEMAKNSPEELVEAMTPPPEPPVTEDGAAAASTPASSSDKDAAPVVAEAATGKSGQNGEPASAQPTPSQSAQAAAMDGTDTPETQGAAPQGADEPIEQVKPEWIVGVQVFGPPLPPELPNEMLYDLAGGRTDSVRDYLAGQNLDPKRLLPCSPEIAHDEDVLPQTRVSIDSL